LLDRLVAFAQLDLLRSRVEGARAGSEQKAPS
jgi:hypothetical protein